MILYFANRTMDILGHASTNLPEGFAIIEDLKTEEVETGIATFTCKIGFDEKNREQLEAMMNAGNYILRKNDRENEFYTIIDTEIDTKNQEIHIYAEDAGLDLLNEIAEAYEATEAHTAEWYVNKWILDSGFEIGINEIPASSTRKLSWDGESTVTERLASIATQFDGFEVSYSYDIKGTTITNKYVNIYAKRGSDNGVKLRLNSEIDRIIIKKSVANIATALRVTGGTPENAETPITLKGYEYDDGDFWIGSDGALRSREANRKWSRYVWNKEPNKLDGYGGHIFRTYSYDTTSQATLCAHAIAELKSICDMEVNYEVDIVKLPENVKIGDRIDIIDDAGGLYLSSRILLLETSVTDGTQTATIGEHLIKDEGISMKVQEMAAQFAESAKNAEKARLLAETAKTTVTEVQEEVAQASSNLAAAEQNLAAVTSRVDATEAEIAETQEAVEETQRAVTEVETLATSAQSTADSAKETADTARTEASNAAKVATNYIDFVNTGLVIGNMTASTLGKNVLIDSDSIDIRNETTILASFGAELIELGKNSENAVISLCGGNGAISFENQTFKDEIFKSLIVQSEYGVSLNSNTVFSAYVENADLLSASQLLIEPHKITESADYIELYTDVGFYVRSDELIDLYSVDSISFTTENAIEFDAPNGLILQNNQRIYSADTNGINREIMRLSDASTPTLVIGDGLYTAGTGYTNISGGTIVRLLTTAERVILENSTTSTHSAYFRPQNDAKCTLGTASKRWYAVYANNSTIQTSDKREKENIMPLGKNLMPILLENGESEIIDLYSVLFDRLRPVQYNFIKGNKKKCFGLIAQDVLEVMRELEIGENELDLVHHDFWNDTETGEVTETYGLAYTNLIALLIYEVQKLKSEVAALEAA